MSEAGVLLLAACDAAYHERFGRAFIHSAVAHGNRVHLHLINPTAAVRRVEHPAVTYSQEVGAPEAPGWLASCRFLRAADIYRSQPQPHDRMLILDADSIVRAKLEPPSAPVGLFLRTPLGGSPRTRRRRRVAAGLVMLGPGGEPFFDALAERLKAATYDWYVDQLALVDTLDARVGWGEVHDFGQDRRWMDWEFSADSIVWTAKGPRKFESRPYLSELARWSDPVGV